MDNGICLPGAQELRGGQVEDWTLSSTERGAPPVNAG
jgi:hypothetical protein